MIKILQVFLLLTTSFIFSQETITGKVINAESEKSLPYVNIGVLHKNIGTVSDNKGNFRLKLVDNMDSSGKVIFSHIGYKTQEHKISSLLNKSNTLKLEPLTTNLEGVVIKSKAPKPKKLGRKGIGLGTMHSNFYSTYQKVEDLLSKEMGVKLAIRKNCRIDALNFNISSNQFKSLKFRANFYAIEKGLPGHLLNTEDIIFEIKDEYLGWFKVDLKPYGIFLEKELGEIAVTIQWLESEKINEKSKYFAIPTKVATSKSYFYREKAMDKWVNKKYKPSFYLDAQCNNALD